MDIEQLTDRISRVTESIRSLDMDLFDLDDPLVEDLIIQISIVSKANGWSQDRIEHTEFLMVLGYIAGRLRGRKEAVMAEMLRTEGDNA